MKMTSAYANKIIKQLKEERMFLLNREHEDSTYTVAEDEEPLIPEYNYEEIRNKISEINEKICKIKHAINVANTTQSVTIGDKEYTIDMLLVRMAQLNERKVVFNELRSKSLRARKSGYYSPSSRPIEYVYTNYDPEVAKADFEKTSREIMDIQLALDRHNQTYTFEVEI
jgi:hypothetical protein